MPWNANNAFRWPGTTYLHVGYIFELHVLAQKIRPISLISGILNKECSNFKEMLFIFLIEVKFLKICKFLKTWLKKKMSIILKPYDRFSLNLTKQA